MSDKNELTISLVAHGGVATGKTAILGLIAKSLREAGFETQVDNHGDEPHDPYTEAQILKELPVKTRIRLITIEASTPGGVKSASVYAAVRLTEATQDRTRAPIDDKTLSPRLSAPPGSTKLYPLWSKENASFFIDTGGQTLGISDYHVAQGRPTLPLKFGERIPLLHLSTAEDLVEQGWQAITDVIFPVAVRLDSLVFRVPSGQFVAQTLSQLGVSSDVYFEGAVQDASWRRLATKQFTLQLRINQETRDIFGEPLNPPMSPCLLSFVVELESSLHTEMGEVQIHLARAYLNSIITTTANQPPQPTLRSVVTLEGYTLDALRMRRHHLPDRSQVFPIPSHPTINRP